MADVQSGAFSVSGKTAIVTGAGSGTIVLRKVSSNKFGVLMKVQVSTSRSLPSS